ncbi:hypothetical protein H5410_003262 [Solanum commersonii]|uniref:Polyprotein protein n=1 Tax=Solanum commersonii TaxID=4109 RepID=A0A9J6B4B8_SOLCO|nr:hypothetical protein H5410_003262 [Solanum commersonii]
MDGTIVDESEAEIDEELIMITEESINRDLPNIEETIVQSVIQTSLTKKSMGGSNGAGPSEVTLSIVAQVPSTTPGTIAPSDRVTV